MKKFISLAKDGAGILFPLGLALCLLVASNWVFPPSGPVFWQARRSLYPPAPLVDIGKARQALDSGGALTYEEIEALSRQILDAGLALPPGAASVQERAARERDFIKKVEKCKLKESIGWIVDLTPARVNVVLADPYSREADPIGPAALYASVYLTGLLKEQMGQMKYGQRIRFSGDLSFNFVRVVSVRNVRYELLEDDPPVPTPTDAELGDLTIVLRRSFGLDGCPDYTLTIAQDGTVTFSGRVCTGGAPTSTLARAQLAEIAREVKKADFFTLKDEYPADVADGPRETLSVQMGGESKTVRHDGGGPAKLYVLMDRIDQITNIGQP